MDLAGSMCMVGIFAIIAIYSQVIFAIAAISFFANIANTSKMNEIDLRNKEWLAKNLEAVSRGEKGRIAKSVGIDGTKLSRMANTDPDANPKNTQTIPLSILRKFADIFDNVPPGLAAPRELPPPARLRTRENSETSSKPRVRRSLDALVKNAPDHVFDLAFDIVKLVTERGRGEDN
jgi:hypothetical protein